MENNCGSVDGGGGSPAAGGSRWNPTKEQIGILEGLYKQGIRTPTAEQIQQITARLRAYGHIEGKNVFYWFQNHKARQRQRERQDSLALINRCFHRSRATPFHHQFSPCPTVVCQPYCIPHSEIGYYPAHPKFLLPCGMKRRQSPALIDEKREISEHRLMNNPGSRLTYHDDLMTSLAGNDGEVGCADEDHKTTLDLFPLQPTSNAKESRASASGEGSTIYSSFGVREYPKEQQPPYFDFFSGEEVAMNNEL